MGGGGGGGKVTGQWIIPPPRPRGGGGGGGGGGGLSLIGALNKVVWCPPTDPTFNSQKEPTAHAQQIKSN